MVKNYIKALLFLLIISGAIFGVAILWKDISFEWYMMRLKTESEGGKIIYYEEKIQAIAPAVMPRLKKYFFDPNTASIQRRAATFGLSACNKEEAKRIFYRGLHSEKEYMVIDSIYGLGLIKDQDAFNVVSTYVKSENDTVRIEVARYYLYVLMEKSIPILKEMLTDKNDYVRSLASDALKKIS